MLWATLVAGGVAVVSMAIFGARLTRKPQEDPHEEFGPPADPQDPWAAWRPRPFEELDRPPRPRLWPVLASLTGLVLVGGGLAGARQTFQQPDAIAADAGTEPFLLEIKVTPTPTPLATPTPKPIARPAQTPARQQAAAAQPAPASAVGPAISGSASCSERKARVSFVVNARGAQVSYIGVYLDGKVVGGGPVSSTRYQGSVERTTTAGPHDLEVSAQDKAGHSARKQWRVNCA